MLDLVTHDHTYGPETVAAMAAAFDGVCRSVSTRINDDEDVRRQLASIIIRYVDRGLRDPARLTDVALRELRGLAGWRWDD